VNRINASYPRQQLKAETAAVWYAELARFDAAMLTMVLRDHVRYSSFAPSCAELYQGALALLQEQPTGAAALPAPSSQGAPMPDHVRAKFVEMGLYKLKSVPADDRADPVAFEEHRRMVMADLAAMSEQEPP
jgi:hypothetical protein